MELTTLNIAEVAVSEHAYLRFKQRVGLGRKAAFRLAKKAFFCGYDYLKIEGEIYKILSQRRDINITNESCIKLYGEYVYVFYKKDENTFLLATVLYMRNSIKRKIRKII